MRRNPQHNAGILYQIADGQEGYFTAAQARQAGYAYSQQHYHVSSGRWQKIERGLFRLRDYPPGEREDLVRLTLWSHNRKGKPQATVSHYTALAVHNLSDLMPVEIHLTVPPRFRKEPPPGCVFHKAILTQCDSEQRPGYRITTPLRTLFDIADTPLSQEHLNKAVQDALEMGLVRRGLLQTASGSFTARQRLDQSLLAAQRQELLT